MPTGTSGGFHTPNHYKYLSPTNLIHHQNRTQFTKFRLSAAQTAQFSPQAVQIFKASPLFILTVRPHSHKIDGLQYSLFLDYSYENLFS